MVCNRSRHTLRHNTHLTSRLCTFLFAKVVERVQRAPCPDDEQHGEVSCLEQERRPPCGWVDVEGELDGRHAEDAGEDGCPVPRATGAVAQAPTHGAHEEEGQREKVPRVELVVQRASEDDAHKVALQQHQGDVARRQDACTSAGALQHVATVCVEVRVPHSAIGSRPDGSQEDEEGEGVKGEQSKGKLAVHKRLWVQELPVDSPLVHEDTRELKRPAHVAPEVFEQEGHSDEQLQGGAIANVEQRLRWAHCLHEQREQARREEQDVHLDGGGG
mmetsp:Transcript_16879/g.54052  ORF Transcript_16879/g.54052 Transcript_16879/m.54052 type:complete len:274 (+) Transcript_16879:571-1392(+)